jgi:quercetin dioxygenase-like cupin family protein
MSAITRFVVSLCVMLFTAGQLARAQVIGPDAGEARMVGGVRPLLLKVDRQTVGSKQFVAGMETVPPGAPFPTHKHPEYEEILFVHKGTLTITLAEGPPQEASAGSIISSRRTPGREWPIKDQNLPPLSSSSRKHL